MTVDNPQIKVRDRFHRPIEVGSLVVVPHINGRDNLALYTGTVSYISVPNRAVRLEGYSPVCDLDQVIVLPSPLNDVTTFDPGPQVPWNGEWKGLLTPEEEIAAHVVTVGTDAGGWRAKCPCGAQFPWHQIVKEGARKAKSAAQRDAVEHMAEVRRRAHGEEYSRASGAAICARCTLMYGDHPSEQFPSSTGDLADSPLVLHRLCDGRLVKL